MDVTTAVVSLSRRRFVTAAAVAVAVAVVALQLQLLAGAAAVANNCTRRCGDIELEYPFGVQAGCYHPGFNLTCNHSYQRHSDGTVQVLGISIPNATVRINSSVITLYDDDDDDRSKDVAWRWWGKGLSNTGPYFLSESKSLLALVGCNAQVDVMVPAAAADRRNQTVVGSCTAICPPSTSDNSTIGAADDDVCSGIGCCQTNIILGYPSYPIQMKVLEGKHLPILFVYMIDQGFNFSMDVFFGKHPRGLPASLDWIISNSTSTCPRNASAPECLSAHSSCRDSVANAHQGYRCECSHDYQGNPYIIDGCYDIDECSSPDIYPCYGNCKNKPGGYDCDCLEGFKGNATLLKGCEGSTIALIVCGGSIVLFLVIASPFVIRVIKKHQEKKLKEKFFKQNHGLLLQQLISKNTDFGDRMIITLEELQKATNNFDRTRQVGAGGHGIREISEFINEVAILSQVNHRNVVKLLGCCLETEVPLLVYEFISNGTLYHHLHIEGPVSLSWDDRLRIALEVARALSYLHSASLMPIYHRDIKSANILIDDSLTAKVSDFGASKYTPVERSEITTAIQVTIGYLDPMYYYTGRLTDKSDVFSFWSSSCGIVNSKKTYCRYV
uniref:Protein kinase domain-containing protein n=1 Tax=Oryza rufipogon TaxID=4529 RepID=A0A0E0QI61_ORYRU